MEAAKLQASSSAGYSRVLVCRYVHILNIDRQSLSSAQINSNISDTAFSVAVYNAAVFDKAFELLRSQKFDIVIYSSMPECEDYSLMADMICRIQPHAGIFCHVSPEDYDRAIKMLPADVTFILKGPQSPALLSAAIIRYAEKRDLPHRSVCAAGQYDSSAGVHYSLPDGHWGRALPSFERANRDDLEYRLATEIALSRISALLAFEKIADLDQILAEIGQTLKVCAVLLFEHNGEDVFSRTHKWYSGFSRCKLEKFTSVENTACPWLVKMLHQDRNVAVNDISDFGEEQAVDRKFFEAFNVRSFLAVPISLVGGQLHGFLAVFKAGDGVDWRQEDIRLLRTVANMLVAYIERRNAEADIRHQHRNIQKLNNELSVVEERQRRAIAEGLHDSIIQPLVFADIQISNLLKKCKDAQLRRGLGDLQTVVSDMILQSRNLTFDLCCPILYELGLEAAVEELAHNFLERQHGLKVSFSDDGPTRIKSEDLKIMLFRSVRELLVNVVKHARAKSVEIIVRYVENMILIGIRDDGVGLDVSKLKHNHYHSGGLGIFSISQRLDYIGGCVEIERLNKGTAVSIRAPIEISNDTD